MLLSYEKSHPGRSSDYLPELNHTDKAAALSSIPENLRRKSLPRLPEMAETDVSRHFTELENETFGVNDGVYLLGSCTMKYNPKVNDKVASMPQFANLHPTQVADTVQGAWAAGTLLQKLLVEITGMDSMSFAPMAGAHGEFTALLMIAKYHRSRGDLARTEILVPDSAHGTNPASAAMAGFKVVAVPSDEKGCVDIAELPKYLSERTAGLMLTNPNTLGIFDLNILEITKLVHEAGGLNYYDGANLNAVLGLSRPGDMGFDLVHLNLHKTFSTPHGGGGPGSGPVGCKEFLMPYLPQDQYAVQWTDSTRQEPLNAVNIFRSLQENGTDDLLFYLEEPEQSCGRVGTNIGNYLVYLRALCYILRLGRQGLPEVGRQAVLNANYMQAGLHDILPAYFDQTCMHEFVVSLSDLKKETGISAKEFAKSLQDQGMHPPTMYFPLNVPEALMVEPTETESMETLDAAIAGFRKVYDMAHEDPGYVALSPHKQSISRPDETTAARRPVVRYMFGEEA